jgi:hypothetical protein
VIVAPTITFYADHRRNDHEREARVIAREAGDRPDRRPIA